MDFEYKSLSTAELLEILTKSTMKYNHILLEGGPIDEYEILREAIKLIQKEVERRKEGEVQ
jgi:riboflavin biosynthesis pyrimidine reductase